MSTLITKIKASSPRRFQAKTGTFRRLVSSAQILLSGSGSKNCGDKGFGEKDLGSKGFGDNTFGGHGCVSDGSSSDDLEVEGSESGGVGFKGSEGSGEDASGDDYFGREYFGGYSTAPASATLSSSAPTRSSPMAFGSCSEYSNGRRKRILVTECKHRYESRGPLGPTHGQPTFDIQFHKMVWDHEADEQERHPHGLRRISSSPAEIWYEEVQVVDEDITGTVWRGLSVQLGQYRDYFRLYLDQDFQTYDEEVDERVLEERADKAGRSAGSSHANVIDDDDDYSLGAAQHQYREVPVINDEEYYPMRIPQIPDSSSSYYGEEDNSSSYYGEDGSPKGSFPNGSEDLTDDEVDNVRRVQSDPSCYTKFELFSEEYGPPRRPLSPVVGPADELWDDL